MLNVWVFQHASVTLASRGDASGSAISLVELVNKGCLNNFGLVYSSGRWRGRRHAIGAVGTVVRGIVGIGRRRVLGPIVWFAVAVGFGVGVVVTVRRWRG